MNYKKIVYGTIVLIFLSSIPVCSQPMESTQTIDSILTSKSDKPFSGVVLVTQDGKIRYSNCFGFSDRENKVPLKMNDKFVVGSISKQFTAVLVLREFDKGNLKLHEPIKTYLPALNKYWADTVTVHHLLTHTHGIAELNQPLLFKPGTQFSYSQLGYELLAKVVEANSGKSFAQCASELFQKCKMYQTSYPDAKAKKQIVKGYTEDSNEGVDFDTTTFENYVAAGGFLSTANDLVRWNSLLHGGKLLKSSTYQKMIATYLNAKRNHPIFGETAYGYGITISEGKDLVQLGQTGLAPGFVSMNFYFPASQTSLVVLSNIWYDPDNLKLSFSRHVELLKYIQSYLTSYNQ